KTACFPYAKSDVQNDAFCWLFGNTISRGFFVHPGWDWLWASERPRARHARANQWQQITRQLCPARDIDVIVRSYRPEVGYDAVRARLDSEQLRVAPRTSRPLRGRLIVRQTDCVGPSAGGWVFRGAHPRRGSKPP